MDGKTNMVKLGELSYSHGGQYKDDCLWDVAPCSLVMPTDVSEVNAANILRAMSDDADNKHT
jgi:hypothetical protein